jgi:hypothetical protein
MMVPDRSSAFWTVLYAAVGLGTVASLALLRFADASVLPWAVGIIALGLACLAVIRWEQRHLAGRGTAQQTGAPDYWNTRRRIAAGGGLSALVILAVIAAFTVPSTLGFTALVLMFVVIGLLVYVLMPTG